MHQYALVLTSSPNNPAINSSIIAELATPGAWPSTLDVSSNFNLSNLSWLNPHVACELVISTPFSAKNELLEAIRLKLGSHQIDANIVAIGTNRRKSLLIADMDSTIIQQECIDELADYAGVGARVAGITEQAMRGEIDFEGALKDRLSLLKGLHRNDLAKVLETRITLMPGACQLVATMAAHGSYCALVSGGFTAFTSEISRRVGFHENHANVLQFDCDKLSGHADEPILGREAKLERLKTLLEDKRAPAEISLAVGDGANDLAMIKYAGLGVAYRAKPVVAAQADARIKHGDLTALLYLQGYSIDEFALRTD